MKSKFFLFFSLVSLSSAIAQNERYEFYKGNSNMVYQQGKSALVTEPSFITSDALCSAKLMSDVIKDYPKDYYNSLIDYVSIEISSKVNGKEVSAGGTTDTLNAAQKNILDNADFNSAVCIKILFQYKDPANDGMGSGRKIKEMVYILNIIPAKEAEYDGGIDKMTSYLKENVLNKVPVTSANAKVPNISVIFTVNEFGYTTDVKMGKNSTDPNFDKLLMEAVNNMPKWKPAENAKGTKVKQQFTIGIPTVPRGC
jgi:hypothetical protein